MTAGVVAAARAARGVDRVFIVTSEPGAASLGAATLDDGGLPWNEGLAHAIAALAPVPDAVAIVAGDLPLVTAADVEALVAAIPARGVAVARALDAGSNGLGLRPPAALVPNFGVPGSAAAPPRARAGRRAGEAVLVDRPGLAHDVDTPADAERVRALLPPGPVRDLLDHRVPASRLKDMPLNLAYKASRGAVRPARRCSTTRVHAEAVGLEVVLDLRPLPALAPPRRPLAVRAPLAGRARRARRERRTLGTSVLTPTMRYEPAVMAQAFATLACLDPGRVFLGVGTGEAMNETPVTGGAWPGRKERRLRLAEAVELIRRLWTRGARRRSRASTTGPARDDLRPARASRCRSTSRRAGRWRRSSSAASATASSAPAARSRELYRDAARGRRARAPSAAGRDPAAIARMIEIKVSYDRDRERASRRPAAGGRRWR